MGRRVLQIKTKLKIIAKEKSTGNKKATARKYKVQAKQIRTWIEKEEELKAKLAVNKKAKATHCGGLVMHKGLEDQVYDWLIEQRNNGFAVSTSDIISKALSLNPDS